MHVVIGPYEVTQRTEYSKLKIYDVRTNKEVDMEGVLDIDNIINAYNEQKLHPEKFYIIKDNCLIKTKEVVSDNTEYFFVPEGVTKISEGAFDRNAMKFVSLPNTLEIIDSGAFHGCGKLEYIYIPDSVKKINPQVFSSCRGLEGVRLPMIDKIDDYMFLSCWQLKDISIPDSVTSIGMSAFCDCSALENIKLSKGLKTFSFNAFSGCRKLSKIDLPESLNIIGADCFSDCNSLKEIYIPDSVCALGKNTFANCTDLEYVRLSENICDIQSVLFTNCINLKNVRFPDNVYKLGRKLFSDTPKLTNINIPKNLSEIDDFPFEYSSLKSLTFNYDLESLDIDSTDLLEKSKIDKLIISNNVKTITPAAFCNSGEQITKIDFKGTKEQFDEFKKNNEELFSYFINLKNIKFEENTQSKEIETYER